MITTFRTIFLAASVLLTGCTTVVISSTRAPAMAEPLTSATVLYVGATLGDRSATPSLGTVLGTIQGIPLGASGSRVTEDARALGEHVLKQLPAALRTAGLTVEVEPMQIATLVTTPDGYASLFGPAAKSPVFVIRPVSARMECPGACFVFRLQVQLLDADYSTQLWSGVFDTPPRASRYHDFSDPAMNFTKTFIGQLRNDNVIK